MSDICYATKINFGTTVSKLLTLFSFYFLCLKLSVISPKKFFPYKNCNEITFESVPYCNAQ